MRVTLTVHGQEHDGEVFEFTEQGSFLFGSSRRSHCRIARDPYVSRSHFYLYIDSSGVRLRDLQSTNGTEVDGKLYTGGKALPLDENEEMQTLVKGEDPPPGEEVFLHDGSVIEAGYTKLCVAIESDLECHVCGGLIPREEKGAARRSNHYVCQECTEMRKLAEAEAIAAADAAARARADEAKKERLEQLVTEGKQLLEQGQGALALDAFREAARIDSDYPGVAVGLSDARAMASPAMEAPPSLKLTQPAPPPPTAGKTSDAMLNRILAKLRMPGPEGAIPAIPGYEIVKLLDRGGMGAVFEAAKLDSNEKVAIKVILPDRSLTRAAKSRFRAEMRLTRELSHPNIVRFIDGGDANGLLWFALEFVPDGLDVGKMMAKVGGRLPREEALLYARLALHGLACAHGKSIIHRDIKPSNILLAPANGGFTAKLSDFGLAKSLEEAQLNASIVTKPGMGMGTWPYMPPEQVVDVRSARPPADVFSMGAALYHMLTGCYIRDFERNQNAMIRQIVQEPAIAMGKRDPSIPVTLARVVDRSLDLEPSRRFPSGAEFLAALESAAG